MRDLTDALRNVGAEIVREQVSKSSATFICRISDEASWMKVVEKMLLAATTAENWDCHICKRFFIKNDKVVYGWNVMFSVASQEGWTDIVNLFLGNRGNSRYIAPDIEDIVMAGLPANYDREAMAHPDGRGARKTVM